MNFDVPEPLLDGLSNGLFISDDELLKSIKSQMGSKFGTGRLDLALGVH